MRYKIAHINKLGVIVKIQHQNKNVLIGNHSIRKINLNYSVKSKTINL
jgi:hypothetical protein